MELFHDNEKYKQVINLIERIEPNYRFLLENRNERVQVTRNEILDWLNATNDNGNVTNGKFASVTYVKAAKIYKTKENWDYEKMRDILNRYWDTQYQERWYKYLEIYNNMEVNKVTNPFSKNAIILVQRYVFHWKTPDSFKEKYTQKYAKPLYDLRLKYNLGVNSNGMLGDNNNQRYTNDYGLQFNQTGKPSIDFDMKQCDFDGKAYFVNNKGMIIGNPIPYEVISNMSYQQDRFKPETEAFNELTREDLVAYTKARNEIIKGFKPQNLLMDQILCIAAWDGTDSFYYINDNLETPIEEDGEVLVNKRQMVKLAEEQLGEAFNGINNFASNNGTEIN